MANDHVKMFAEEYGPIATQVSKQTGIAPSVLLAQWGMESAYGSKLAGQFNFGNIKDVSGGGTEATDNKTKSKDKYVNFESPEAFGDYYAHMMRRLYPNTLNAGTSIPKYAEGLRTGIKGSYAEDENYEKAIKSAHALTQQFYKDPDEIPEIKLPNDESNPFSKFAETSAEEREQRVNERVTSPEEDDIISQLWGAGAGATANLLLPPLTNPQSPRKIDTYKAEERVATTADKRELALRNLQNAIPQGMEDLTDAYNQSRQTLDNIKNEQRLAQEQLKSLPKTPPPFVAPAPPAAEVGSRTAAGDSGAVNWVRKMADDVPDVVARKALNMRADNPRGGQAIIDADMAARARQQSLGLGIYDLAKTEGGVQLALPPTSVEELRAEQERVSKQNQAELDLRTQEAQNQHENQVRRVERTRLAQGAELERLRQQLAAAGRQHQDISGQFKNANQLQRSLTKAETNAELAQRIFSRAQLQPSMLMRPLDVMGAAKMGALPRTMVGGTAGFVGVMSYQDALARFKAGDTSEGVIKALEAGAAAAMLVPPSGRALTRVRGAGALGGLGLGAIELGRALLKERPQE